MSPYFRACSYRASTTLTALIFLDVIYSDECRWLVDAEWVQNHYGVSTPSVSSSDSDDASVDTWNGSESHFPASASASVCLNVSIEINVLLSKHQP